MDIRETTEEILNLLEGYELCSRQAGQVRQLADRMQRQEMTLAVIGQFKRGKTSLVNRILGRDILPVGIVPITAAVTRIRYQRPAAVDAADAGPAADKTARVWFQNGLCEEVPAEDLHSYISEQENRNNERGVAEVELETDADFLKDGLVLVDTPGVGSVHENNSRSAYDFARESDGVIFMLSVDSPINQIEIDFLRDTQRFAGKFYFVVNKIDIIDEEELQEYLDYCNALICSIMEIEPGSEAAGAIRLIPVSAKKDRGVNQLKQTIREDLIRSARSIMDQSAAHKLLEILTDTHRQISAYREVLKMAPNVFHRRFEQMHEELKAWEHKCGSLLTNAPDGSPRLYLRADLNEEKMLLSKKVKELFGIEYVYEVDRSEAAQLLDRDAYAAELAGTCRDLEKTLDTIFMYKEENTYTVARRIEDLNILLQTIDRKLMPELRKEVDNGC
ncbi:MAG: dynamin family protein [Firmicutes bacterium]|nr:dynamin family protein [Bacillota bacterium]